MGIQAASQTAARSLIRVVTSSLQRRSAWVLTTSMTQPWIVSVKFIARVTAFITVVIITNAQADRKQKNVQA